MVPYQKLIKSKYFSLFLIHTDLTDVIFPYIWYYMVSQVVLATFKVGESGFDIFFSMTDSAVSDGSQHYSALDQGFSSGTLKALNRNTEGST